MPKITVHDGPSNVDAEPDDGARIDVQEPILPPETDVVDGDTHYYEQGGDVETLISVGDASNEGTGDEQPETVELVEQPTPATEETAAVADETEQAAVADEKPPVEPKRAPRRGTRS